MDNKDAVSVLEELYTKEKNSYYSSRIGDVQVFIEEQQKTIESLKCCGNCRNVKQGGSLSGVCVGCTIGIQLVTSAEKKDNWQPLPGCPVDGGEG